MGLLSIATMVQGRTALPVEILDGELLDMPTILARLDAQWVGVSISQVTYENSLTIAAEAKARGARVVFGGHHATALAGEILRNRREVDFVVRGDGEDAFSDLVTGRAPSEIPNMVYRGEDGVPQMVKSRLTDLAQLPIPDRTMVPIEAYAQNFQMQNRNKPFRRPFSLFTQKGCAWRDRSGGCSFCARTDTVWRARLPETAWREVEYLVDEFGADYIWELSDDILSNGDWLRALVAAQPPRIRPAFLFYARPGSVNLHAAEDFARLGAYEVFLGVESGADSLLLAANKGSRRASNLRAARLLKRRGIRIFPSFVLGLEGESETTLRQSEDHLDELFEGGLVDAIAVSMFMPLPGSPGYLKLMGLPESAERYRERDRASLRSLQEHWFARFCRISFEEAESTRDRMLAKAPVASGLAVSRATLGSAAFVGVME